MHIASREITAMNGSIITTRTLLFLLCAFSLAIEASEEEYGLYMPTQTVRSLDRLSKDHDSEETFVILEAKATGCDSSNEFGVYYYKARTNRSNVKNNIIEFCTVSHLGVGSFYSGYFQGKTKKGLLVLPPDAIFIADPDGYFRLPSYQVHTRDCDGKTILIGGVRVPDLPTPKNP